ncbi:tRNA dihydrouridine synthase [Granulosicoccus sp. 3-233]|uniref:tRNA dihydrouridine synthase n=1 Tax=Granulosicoccus sp. 3-233 TaxID=3417969 RepID=UPI003D34F421
MPTDIGPDNTGSNIVLAPMEGVIDAPMRRLLTGLGGYTRCVTEFVRVTNVLLPERVFLRLCPELETGGRTEHGVPVYTQLLGSNAEVLAINARRAVAMGAPGVDLNFGCPAKTVNNSLGGSILLREPAQVANIVRQVRDAVPAEVPVTAKIRLGYDNSAQLAEIVGGIREAGATELAIHARTKFDGYKPPAWWHEVAGVVAADDDTTYINGEIWTVEDSHAARRASGCRHLMLGRGALSAPDLAQRIRAAEQQTPFSAWDRESGDHQFVRPSSDEKAPSRAPLSAALPMPWIEISHHVEAQFRRSDSQSPRHVGNRTKQWLAYLKRTYPEANDLFARIRQQREIGPIVHAFAEHRRDLLLEQPLLLSADG